MNFPSFISLWNFIIQWNYHNKYMFILAKGQPSTQDCCFCVFPVKLKGYLWTGELCFYKLLLNFSEVPIWSQSYHWKSLPHYIRGRVVFAKNIDKIIFDLHSFSWEFKVISWCFIDSLLKTLDSFRCFRP